NDVTYSLDREGYFKILVAKKVGKEFSTLEDLTKDILVEQEKPDLNTARNTRLLNNMNKGYFDTSDTLTLELGTISTETNNPIDSQDTVRSALPTFVRKGDVFLMEDY